MEAMSPDAIVNKRRKSYRRGRGAVGWKSSGDASDGCPNRGGSAYLLEHQRRVFRAKRNAIAHCMLDLDVSARFRYIIQIALGIQLLQVDGGGNLPMMHGHH